MQTKYLLHGDFPNNEMLFSAARPHDEGLYYEGANPLDALAPIRIGIDLNNRITLSAYVQ